MERETSKTLQTILKLLLIFIVILITSCGNERKLPNIGEKCNITEQCLSAKDGYFDELNQVSDKKDEGRLAEMISDGVVMVLETYFEFTMLENSFPKCKIKVTDTRGKEYEVWVSSEFIKEKK